LELIEMGQKLTRYATTEKAITLADSPYTASPNFNCIKVNTAGGNVRVNLPVVDYPIDVIKTSSDAYIVTIWVGGTQIGEVAGELSVVTVENAEVTKDEPWYPYDVIVGIAGVSGDGGEVIAKDRFGHVITRIDSLGDVATILSGLENDVILNTGTYYVKSDITISDKKIQFAPGAKFSVDPDITLTFDNTCIEAHDGQHIFTGSGTIAGVVVCPRVSIDWFGAVGDSTTDDAVAIQKAANLARYSSSKTLYIPNKTYYFNSDITIYSNVNCDGKLIKKILIDHDKTVMNCYLESCYPTKDAKIYINTSLTTYSLIPSQFDGIVENGTSIPVMDDVAVVGGGTIDLEIGGSISIVDTDFFTSRNNGKGDSFYNKEDSCQITDRYGDVFPEFCFSYEDIDIETVGVHSDTTIYSKGDYVKVGTDIYKSTYPSGPGTTYTDSVHGVAVIGPQSPEVGVIKNLVYPDESTDTIRIWTLVSRTVYYRPPEDRIAINGLKLEIWYSELDGAKRRVNSIPVNVHRDGVVFNDCSFVVIDAALMLSHIVFMKNVVDIEFNRCYLSGATYHGLGYNVTSYNASNIRFNDCICVNSRHSYGGRHGKNIYFNRGHFWGIDDHYGMNYYITDVENAAKTTNVTGYCTPAADIESFEIISSYAYTFSGKNIYINGGKIKNGLYLLLCRRDVPDLYGDIVIRNVTIESSVTCYIIVMNNIYTTPFDFIHVIRSPNKLLIENIKYSDLGIVLCSDDDPLLYEKISATIVNCSDISSVVSENADIEFMHCGFNETVFDPDTTSLIDFVGCKFSGDVTGLADVYVRSSVSCNVLDGTQSFNVLRIADRVENLENWCAKNIIIGIEHDSSSDSPELKYIDVYGNEINPVSHDFFDKHAIWGNMWRCLLAPDGTPAFGTNARGDGLTLDGSAGQVMVRIPKFYVKSEEVGTKRRAWISPETFDGFEVHPAFLQRGGVERDAIYVGAYVGCLSVDPSDGDLYMLSKTGEQPWTGTGMGKLPFGSGSVEIAAGDIVVGANSGKTGIVVAVYVDSGTWAEENAAGFLYVKYPGAEWSDWTNPEDILVGGDTRAATTGVGEVLGLTRQNAETYCNNIGSTRWGCENIWTLDALTMLYLVEYANWNSQSTSVGIGRGVVDKVSGTGFAGENNGAHSADTNIGTNGTGTGTGTNGLTPIVYRGIENLWGNVNQFVIGIDVMDAAYRVLKRDGTGTPKCPMDDGNYESSIAAPVQYADTANPDSYAKDILYEDLSKYLILPNLGGGSDSTYICDYVYWHKAGQTNVWLAGGAWNGAAVAGVGCRHASYVASALRRTSSARPEFI